MNFITSIKKSESLYSTPYFSAYDYLLYFNEYTNILQHFKKALKDEGLTEENRNTFQFIKEYHPKTTKRQLDFVNDVLHEKSISAISNCSTVEEEAELLKNEFVAFSNAEEEYNRVKFAVEELLLFETIAEAIDTNADFSQYFDKSKISKIVRSLAKSARMFADDFVRQAKPDEIITRMQTVVDWMEKTFPVYRREMQQADLVGLHDKYGGEDIDSEKVEKELSKRNTIDPDKDFEIIIKRCVKKKSA